MYVFFFFVFFFFKQKTAYEMRISDWSSDVCSSDLEKGPRERNYVGRISARFAASDELDFLLKLERGRNKFENASGGMPGQWSICPWPGTYPINRYCGLAVARSVPLGFDDRKSVVLEKSESVRLDLGGRRYIKKKKT